MMNRIRRDDRGVAMVTSLLVISVLTALGITVTQVALNNLSNAGRDRLATGALGAAEAGVTRAIAYINRTNTNGLRCSPSCASNPWGNSTTPQTVSLPDGRSAKVWIEKVQGYAPPTYKTGIYKIHSVGTTGPAAANPGQRTLEVSVEVKPMSFPLGVFTHQKINAGGTADVTSESILSDSCIDNRSHITMTAIDSYYGIPSAAHSTKYITDANLSACDNDLDNVQNTDKKAIHYKSTGVCNSTYPYDQDGTPLGGAFPAGSPCLTAANQYTSSSYFDLNMLQSDPYNYLPRGLTDAQYALLKARAQAQGTYYTTSAPPSWPTATSTPNPVIYFKIPAGQEVSIQTDLNTYAWTSDPACTNDHPSVVIVVEGGDLRINSSAALSGAVFVPDGNLTYNGGADLVGTIFANQLKFTGNANVGLNTCYTKSTPGGVLEIKPIRFHEVDR